jgi:hypothetical protein
MSTIFTIFSHHQNSNLEAEDKILVTKLELGGSFGMNLEGDCHEVEITPNLGLLVTYGVSLEGVCQELYT